MAYYKTSVIIVGSRFIHVGQYITLMNVKLYILFRSLTFTDGLRKDGKGLAALLFKLIY